MNKLLFILLSVITVSCNHTYFSDTVIYDASQQKHEKVIRLDLSGENLQQLPEDIEQYINLRFINLSNNPKLDLTAAFEQLKNLTNLTVLKLDSNGLEELPSNINHIVLLQNLSLSYNPTLNLDKALKQLSSLTYLTALNLSHNNIVEIPESVSGLVQLKNIRLSDNNINSSLTYSRLAKIDELKFLWLDHNNIKELPVSVGELTQIRELYLGNNSLKNLPKEIENCDKLCVLYLGGNEFKDLPNEILETKLRMLVMYGNQITTIPKSYKKIKPPLSILVLDNNYLNFEQQKIATKYFTGFFLLSMKNQK
ncbi:MAG: hypothetical protein JKY30_11105 [Flavobacteriales bacterium]|nr:hypothetical protein [Flavobacteriales bacterium]